METQVCNKCNKEKPLSEFYFRTDNNKYRKDCKECFKKAKAIRESKPGVKELRALKERERRANDDGTINAKAREYHRSDYSKKISKEWVKNNNGEQPNIQAFDHKEKRMAEAILFLRELKRKKALANG